MDYLYAAIKKGKNRIKERENNIDDMKRWLR